MVFPTAQQLSQKPSSDTYTVPESQIDTAAPTWGIWSSGLGVAVIGGFLFPFLGIPAVVIAIFAYVDFKTDDWNGFKRKRTITKGLGIAAVIIALILLSLMAACKFARVAHKWRHGEYNKDWREEVRPSMYCHRANSDCYGRDIRHIPNVDLRHCHLACDADPNCVSVQHFASLCWLKNHFCEASELRTVSGLNDYVKQQWLEDAHKGDCDKLKEDVNKLHCDDYCVREPDEWTCQMVGNFCHRPQADCYGHDIAEYQNLDVKTCLDNCMRLPSCKSVQHDASDRRCWLKNYVCQKNDLSTSLPNKNDYVRRGDGETCDGL